MTKKELRAEALDHLSKYHFDRVICQVDRKLISVYEFLHLIANRVEKGIITPAEAAEAIETCFSLRLKARTVNELKRRKEAARNDNI